MKNQNPNRIVLVSTLGEYFIYRIYKNGSIQKYAISTQKGGTYEGEFLSEEEALDFIREAYKEEDEVHFGPFYS